MTFRDGGRRKVDHDKFPIAVLRGNIDAFNEFNSTYGHLAGDQRLDDFLNLEKYKRVGLSWGYGIQKNQQDPLDKIYDEAEAFMNNRKFYNQKSIRSKTINVIMQTPFIKGEREKEHFERVGKLGEKTADRLNLNKSQIDKVRIAGYLHDIRKSGSTKPSLINPSSSTSGSGKS